MGLRGRLRRLEESNATGEDPGPEPQDLEARRAAFWESWQSAKEQAEREAAAGDSRRLHALQQLERRMRERVERGRRGES